MVLLHQSRFAPSLSELSRLQSSLLLSHLHGLDSLRILGLSRLGSSPLDLGFVAGLASLVTLLDEINPSLTVPIIESSSITGIIS